MKQYISPELPESPPGETILIKAPTRNRLIFYGGIVFTFIPPFILGPLVLLVYYLKRGSILILTEKRIFICVARLKGFCISEIQLDRLLNVSVKLNILDNFINGAGDIIIRSTSDDGTRTLMFLDCVKPYDVRRRILEAAGINE